MNIFRFFNDLQYPKPYNQEYNFLDIVFLVVTAVMSGADTWKGIKLFGDYHLDWLRNYRSFEQGIPVDDTIARMTKRIESQAFNDIFINFINEIRLKQGRDLIAVDGKTLRHNFNPETQSALHSITVWSKTQGLVLCLKKSAGKKNEQLGVLEILDSLSLKGAIISVDAMNTQKKIAEKIKEKKADYVIPLKNNHRLFKAEIAAYFHKMTRDNAKKILHFQEVKRKRSRIDERHYQALPINTQWLEGSKKWKGIQTLICVERKRLEKGEEYSEMAYYISSLSLKNTRLEDIARSIRGHWEVENKAHWVLDVVYKEDEYAITDEWGAENLAILRRLGMNLIRLHPKKESMKSKLTIASYSDEFRDELLMGPVIGQ